MNFKVGDIVMCVNTGSIDGVFAYGAPELELYKEYEVLGFSESDSLKIGSRSYYHQRFVLSKRTIWNEEIKEICSEM